MRNRTKEKAASRCAIYTRKSSEEGLEQDFNSLDAQREACAAFAAHASNCSNAMAPLHEYHAILCEGAQVLDAYGCDLHSPTPRNRGL